MSNNFSIAWVEDASRYLSERGTTIQKDESNGEIPLMIPAIKYLPYGTIKDCAEICGITLPEFENKTYGVSLSVNPGSDEEAGYRGEIAIYTEKDNLIVTDDIFARTLFPEVYDSVAELNNPLPDGAYLPRLSTKRALVGAALVAIASMSGCIDIETSHQAGFDITPSELSAKLGELGISEKDYVDSKTSCIGKNGSMLSICNRYSTEEADVEFCLEGERIYGTDENGTEWALGCDNGSVATYLVIPDGEGGAYLFPTTCPDGCQG